MPLRAPFRVPGNEFPAGGQAIEIAPDRQGRASTYVDADKWDWDELIRDALRAGIGAREFWDLTPAEVAMAFEAAAWRQRQEMRRAAWLAWHTAGLMRTKRMPPLSILSPQEPRKVSVEQRRQEHAEIVKRLGNDRRK